MGIQFGGGYGSSTQGAMFVPKPGSDSLIYLFTTDRGENAGMDGWRYSIIDRTLDNGKGGIIPAQKRILLMSPCTEKQNAVHHANCHDVWIMAHEFATNNFWAYLLTDSGITTPPVISSVGAFPSGPIPIASGGMKFSPDGKKIIMVTACYNTVQLFEFDNNTGIVSNPITLPSDTCDYGVSFSPDSKKLYINQPGGMFGLASLYQYDVSVYDSTTIVSTKTLVALGPSPYYAFFSMQLAKDGILYVLLGSNNGDSLSYVKYPNLPCPACEFHLREIDLNLNGAIVHSGANLNTTVESYFNEDTTAYPCFNTGINHLPEDNNNIVIYPNPFSNETFVFIKNYFDKILLINCYDISGRKVNLSYQSNKDENGTVIHIINGNLREGIYMLQLIYKKNIKTIKLINIIDKL